MYYSGNRLDYSEGHTIRAYAVKTGYQASEPASYTFSVSKALIPILTKDEKAQGAVVSLSTNNPSEQIYYSLNGGNFTRYTNSVTLTKTASIQYYGRLSGYAESEVKTETIQVSKPTTPTISLKNNANKIALGESVILAWNSISNAAGYKLRISKDSVVLEEKDVEGLSAAYTLEETGTYQFEVEAYNVFGNSGYSNQISI